MARKKNLEAAPETALPAQIDETPGVFGALPPFDPQTERVAEPAAEEVTLLKPHTHAGRDYAAGDKLTVRPPIATWLRAHGVIADPSSDPV